MKLFLLIIGLGLVSAASLKNFKGTKDEDANEDTSLDITFPIRASDDSDDLSYTIILGTSSGLGHRCWTKVWVVKICTFITPEESFNGLGSAEEGSTGKMVKETESCDKLGCEMFCKKNHFKRGVCHEKGCECDFE